MLHFLYKIDDNQHETYLVGTFDRYEAMCESIGRFVADETDFGYEDEDGEFHQTEDDADQYAATFWQPGYQHIETIGAARYWFQKVELSKRELLRFWETGQPILKHDAVGSSFAHQVWDHEQRFFDEPVKRFTFGIHPLDWLGDGLTAPYCERTVYAPDEQRARAVFDQQDWTYITAPYEVRVTVTERPTTVE